MRGGAPPLAVTPHLATPPAPPAKGGGAESGRRLLTAEGALPPVPRSAAPGAGGSRSRSHSRPSSSRP
eukprot:4567704-Alexandrium_andersonii.AAC.1